MGVTIAYALVSLATSFIGSFLCFVIWVHFHLDRHWQDRNDRLERERWARSHDGQTELDRHAAALRDLANEELP